MGRRATLVRTLSKGLRVFGPTSWFFLGLLVAAFGAALFWMTRSSYLALKIVAGAVAFVMSSVFGAGLVNQYYAYYTTWGSLVANARGTGVVGYQPGFAAPGPRVRTVPSHTNRPATQPNGAQAVPLAVSPSPAVPTGLVPASVTIPELALTAAPTPGHGRVVQLQLPGAYSRITRNGFVYLPPQYFDPRYARTFFPVVELLHGDPGAANGWIYALNVPGVMDREINAGRIGPMIVVMPSTFQGKHGQACVDAPGGQLDDTYLSTDVPADVIHDFRALPQGPHWAIGGLSDGGFCAANLALRHPSSYGAVASLDGFYSPFDDLAVMNSVFGAGSALIAQNDPSTLALDRSSSLPRFWIMSGSGDTSDTRAAQSFVRILTNREPIQYVVVRSGKHTPSAWRAALPGLLQWTWQTVSGGPTATGTVQLAAPTEAPAKPPASSSAPARPLSSPSSSA
jgi:enterochelin esterase-like enzyme